MILPQCLDVLVLAHNSNYDTFIHLDLMSGYPPMVQCIAVLLPTCWETMNYFVFSFYVSENISVYVSFPFLYPLDLLCRSCRITDNVLKSRSWFVYEKYIFNPHAYHVCLNDDGDPILSFLSLF